MSNILIQPPLPEWTLKDENGMPVCTFIPEVLNVVEVYTSSGDIIRRSVYLALHFKKGESSETTIDWLELAHMDWSKQDRRCLLNPDYQRAQSYIATVIRAEASQAPVETKYRLDRLGIHHFDNEVVFAAGDRVITRSPVSKTNSKFEIAQLPFRLDIDKNLSAKESFEGLRQLISLSSEIGPVLVAHVISGIIRAAFKEAALIPCAVLVIVGKSGMLKSHYVPHLAQLYNRADGIGAVTRFNSTARFIEDTLYEYSECTAVIDDLHTAESNGIKRKNEDTAEEIIRRIADDTGRRRMEGKSQIQRHFRGNAVFIGEYTIGRASTVARALVVDLTKRPNGAIFDKFQRHKPLHVSTFYYYFIQWYVDHFDDIRNVIDERLTNLREKSVDSSTHGRLLDTQFYLQTSYMVFLEFCKDSGFCSKEDVMGTYKFFRFYLAKLVREQENRYRESLDTKTIDYLALIRKLYDQEKFRIPKKEKDFNPDKHDGLIHYKCLCLRGNSLDQKLKQIQSDCNLKDCVNYLRSKNALKLVQQRTNNRVIISIAINADL